MNDLLMRPILTSIAGWLNKHEIIVLLGARRVGKTSLMKLLIDKFLTQPSLYLDLEDLTLLKNLENVSTFLSYLEAKGWKRDSSITLLIDEIQQHPNPSNFLKLIHDHHPEIKLIVSGSSSFDIRKKFKDHLTGRKIIFEIHPLTFQEFLDFKKHPDRHLKKDIHIRNIVENFSIALKGRTLTTQFEQAYEEFVLLGGYPEPVQTVSPEDKIRRLQEIHNTYLQKDIKDIARIENILAFNRLASFLAVQIGNLTNLHAISQEIGVPRREAEFYLEVLEKTFVIKRVHPFSSNRQTEIRKMPKVYYLDSGMRNIMIEDVRSLDLRSDRGALIENAVFSELFKTRQLLQTVDYWRTKQDQEVDFILIHERQPFPVEVKYRALKEPVIPPGLKKFIQEYHPKKAAVITRDFAGHLRLDKTDILFFPAWMV